MENKNNSFDLCTINLVLEHIKKLDHIFNSLFAKLTRGGKCFYVKSIQKNN